MIKVKTAPVKNGNGYPKYSNANPPHKGPKTLAKDESDWFIPSVIPCSFSDVTSEIKLKTVGWKVPVPYDKTIDTIANPKNVPAYGIIARDNIIKIEPIVNIIF